MTGLRFVTAENTVFPDGKHYVTIFMVGEAEEVSAVMARVRSVCAVWRTQVG